MRKANLLILLCAAVSLYGWYVDPGFVNAYLAFSGAAFLQGFVWTPLTALFVHADLAHLLGNMLFLYVFGNTLEEEVGAGRTVAAFFLGGAVSFLLSVPFYGPEVSMVGASAAIFTLTAAVMLVKPLRFSWFFLMPLGLVAILYFLYNSAVVYLMARGVMESSHVGYVSHVIGFGVGLPLGVAWSPRWVRNLLITMALLAVYVVLVAMLNSIFGGFT